MVTDVRRRGLGLGSVAAALVLALGWAGAFAAPVAAATDLAVVVGCLGVDPGSNGPQIRVGFVVSGPDGLYRAVLTGPSGPAQGEGRVAGGRGLVIVPSSGAGDYDDLLVTDVDTGQAVDRGPLTDALPLTVGDKAVACDPAALVVPTDESTGPSTAATPEPTAPTPTATDAPTPDISTAAPLASDATTSSTTSEAPPWLLLAIPGALFVIGGVVLLIRARSGSHSRPAT